MCGSFRGVSNQFDDFTKVCVGTPVDLCGGVVTCGVSAFSMDFQIIAAIDEERGIGSESVNGRPGIPWLVPRDLKLFRDSTEGGVVIMGRLTWESIGQRLKKRTNVVISSATELELEGKDTPHVVFKSLISALEHFRDSVQKIWVIGGAQLYEEAIRLKWCKELHISNIVGKYQCDKFFPKIPEELFYVESRTDHVDFEHVVWRARDISNTADIQYENLIRSVLDHGNSRTNRNAITYSLFCPTPLRFDLSKAFPMLPTKKVAFRLVAEELFWMLRGSTNANELSDVGCKIWKGNADEFYNREGTTAKYGGDLGKVYGHQLKKFGEREADDGFAGQGFGVYEPGFDQMRYILDEIRENPTSRRIMFSYLNPLEMFGKPNEVALPCCHVMAQFYVNDGYLSCSMYQRSCDLFLGACFNVASYALLTELIAKSCSLKAKELVMSFGDVHIYNNAMKQIQQQITRSSYEPPRVEISNRVVGTYLEDLTMDDVKLINYKSHPAIKAEMVV